MHISVWTKRVVTVVVFTAASTLNACECQQCADAPESTAQVSAVNQMCPVMNEPVKASAGVVEYKGEAIGFCCPGCAKKFAGWSDEKKDAYLEKLHAGQAT
ncbi:MAG: hypothetical protein KDA20_07945 [Phycisphaerales bacterium]|nr:hypothetical protein [Phycisphaerales bacterium]